MSGASPILVSKTPALVRVQLEGAEGGCPRSRVGADALEGRGTYVSNDQGYDVLRTPPQDVTAEPSVLGAMLLSKDAISACLELMKGEHFYKPAHASSCESMLHLCMGGETADSVTVWTYLTRTCELARSGAATEMPPLMTALLAAPDAGYCAAVHGGHV